MRTYWLPYGKNRLNFTLPDNLPVDIIAPVETRAAPDPEAVVEAALRHPLGGKSLEDFIGIRTAAIAINDKTRPVPHQHLLPPLLSRLEALGLPPSAIMLIIASGMHPSMPPETFDKVLPAAILQRYPVFCHNAEKEEDLSYLGDTARGTPVWINRHYLQVDLRLVVGNIEPHQFQGFSGGVKSAAIGLAGRVTINHNHAMMIHPLAKLGEYERNPTRLDVEEIGDRIGVHFALNAILNGRKELVHALAGDPKAVMQAGIPLARRICQITVPGAYDLVIASPGGHPKDIDVYQAQKGLAHAALVTRDGGWVILAAACPDGTGSSGFERWMQGMGSYEEIFFRFEREGFQVGPHKAFQIARDAARIHLRTVTDMPADLAARLLLNPAANLQMAVDEALQMIGNSARVAIMPRAGTTIPSLA